MPISNSSYFEELFSSLRRNGVLLGSLTWHSRGSYTLALNSLWPCQKCHSSKCLIDLTLIRCSLCFSRHAKIGIPKTSSNSKRTCVVMLYCVQPTRSLTSAFPLDKRTSSNLRRYSQLKFGKKGKIEGRKLKLEVGTFFTEYSTGFSSNLEEQSTRKFFKELVKEQNISDTYCKVREVFY